MRRVILFAAAAGLVAGAAGCSSSARFVDRQVGGGVVAVPDYQHRDEGLALIKKEVGPDFVLVEEGEVATAAVTKSTVERGEGSVFARMLSWFTGQKETATTVTTSGTATEWRIRYATGQPPVVQTGGPGGVVQTQYVSPSAPTPPALTAPAGPQSRVSVFDKDCKG